MPVETFWALSIVLLTSAGQSEPITWSTLLEKVQQLVPYPWLWIVLCLIVAALRFFIDIGDKLSGILGLLGIECPFHRPKPSESDLQKKRRELLLFLQREIDQRLATSLHERVKLDLYMEDQQQQVGKPRAEVVPPDGPQALADNLPLLNRFFLPFWKRTAQCIPLASTRKIVEVFEQAEIQGKLLILGEPGSGKTTELLYLAEDLLARASENERLPIPLILELSEWKEGEPIEQWIFEKLKKRYDIPKSITKQWLQQNELLLLLDGLDELGLLNQQKCIGAINVFVAERARYGIVVCCRREEYEASQVELNTLNGAVYLEPLREEQIKEFFDRLNRTSLWEYIKESSTLRELARKPLFLYMLVVAYQGRPIASEAELFDAFIAQKLHKERESGVYPPNQEPTPHQTRVYLAWIAQQLEDVRENEFLIERLQPCMLRQNQKDFYFYKLIVVLISGLAGGLLAGPIGGLVLGPAGWQDQSIQLSEKIIFSFPKTLIAGLIIALAGSLMVSFFGLNVGLSDKLIFGLILGLPGGLMFGLKGEQIDEKRFPNQGIWRSLRTLIIVPLIFALICACSIGLLGGLLGGLGIEVSEENIFALLNGGPFIGLIGGLIIGLIIGLFSGLIFGLIIVIRGPLPYLVLRILLTRNGHIPWNYKLFLDHAVELRFMQRVGGRYRFVHDLLRKHFAATPLKYLPSSGNHSPGTERFNQN